MTAESRDLISVKPDDISFIIQKYSYSDSNGQRTTAPRYCLRFIDEPWKNVAAKLENGGFWYFTLHSVYETHMMVGLALETLKELEAFGDKFSEESDANLEDGLCKIILKFVLAGIEPRCIFIEVDDKLEAIQDIYSGEFLYEISKPWKTSSI